MIVIAVIGILAIVLVPRIGTVKTQAKATGLDTNIRLVQGYAESKIDKWVSKNTDVAAIAGDIKKAFSGNENKRIVNPFTSEALNAFAGAATVPDDDYSLYIVETAIASPAKDNPGITSGSGANLKGAVLVVIKDDGAEPIEGIWIYAYDESGSLLEEKTVEVTTI